MKGISISWLAITQSEIDCDSQIKITTTEDIFQKAMSFLELELVES